MARSTHPGPVQHRPAHHPGPDGRTGHSAVGDCRQRSGRVGLTPLRAVEPEPGARGAGYHPSGHVAAHQTQFLLPPAAEGRPHARAGMARAPCALYVEQCLDPEAPVPASGRMPFDSAYCALVEEYSPKVVNFHFGLPEQALLDRVKAAAAKVIASATTVAEARWLEAHGCDAIIAMGLEAGGHRGNFLSTFRCLCAGYLECLLEVVFFASLW